MTIVNLNDYRRPASEQLGVDNPPKPQVIACYHCGREDRFTVITNGVLICCCGTRHELEFMLDP